MNDILFGNPYATVNGVKDAGEALLIYGEQFRNGNFTLSSLQASHVERFTNTLPLEGIGSGVDFLGDVNGDGAVDFIVGGEPPNVYLVYGVPSVSTSPSMSMSASRSIRSTISTSPASAMPTRTPIKTAKSRLKKSRTPRSTPTTQPSNGSKEEVSWTVMWTALGVMITHLRMIIASL